MESQVQMTSTDAVEAGTQILQTWEAPELKVSSVAQQTQASGISTGDGGATS